MSNSLKRLYVYLAIVLFCGLFSAVYEHFSHQVYSNYMVYLFAIPLLLGAVPQFVAVINPRFDVGGLWQKIIHNFAIATLVVGSLLQGMLEIYGTTSTFVPYYFVVGAGLLVVSLGMWVVGFMRQQRI